MTNINTAHKPLKHLYIIGNGFDRHHGAESTYFHFREYLARRNPEIVDTFEMFFGDGNLFSKWSFDALWADFEQNLSELDRQKVFDYIDLMLPEVDEGHDDFSYGQYYATIDEVMNMVTQCTSSMQHHFHKWINTLHYKRGFKRKMVELEHEAIFLNFNYTLQLECEYHIPREQILYIHGDRRDKIGELIFGHNIEDSDQAFEQWKHKHKNRPGYRPNLKDRKGRYYANDKLVYLAYFLEDKTKGNYRKTIRYYVIDPALQALEGYYDKNIKHCKSIIEQNSSFFASLSQLEQITVLGHSLGKVDRAYFEKIVEVVGRNVKWNFSYYSDNDITRINAFCRRLKIPKPTGAQLFKMEDIVKK